LAIIIRRSTSFDVQPLRKLILSSVSLRRSRGRRKMADHAQDRATSPNPFARPPACVKILNRYGE
jgi:hypothetical protein